MIWIAYHVLDQGDYIAASQKVLVIDLNETAEYQRLLEGQPQTCGMCSGRVYLQPGQACGQHSTENREELLIFLTGQGQLIIPDVETFQVGKGKVCYIPPSTIHDVKNTGTEPLTYIYCVAPVNPVGDKSLNGIKPHPHL